MSANASPVGCVGRVTASGAIRAGRLGEVMVATRGGVEAFLARDADGGEIGPPIAARRAAACSRSSPGAARS